MTSAVVLAAGLSTRMGVDKLLLDLAGKKIIQRVLENLRASRATEIIVVVGSSAPKRVFAAAGDRTRVVMNDSPARGRTFSLKLGIREMARDSQAFLVATGDMPFIRPETFNMVLDAAQRNGPGVAVATYAARRGHPVGFHRRYVDRILSLEDDEPLNALTRQSHVEIETDDPGVLLNINTAEDYEKALRLLSPSSSVLRI